MEWLSLKAFYFYYLIWSLQTPWEGIREDINILMSLIKGVRMRVELVLKVTVIGRPRGQWISHHQPHVPGHWVLRPHKLHPLNFLPGTSVHPIVQQTIFFKKKKKSPFISCLPSCPAHSGFPGGSDDGEESACNAGDLGSIPGSERSPGGGHGNPLQSSCLENSMNRGAWWATVCGVTKSQTRLSN